MKYTAITDRTRAVQSDGRVGFTTEYRFSGSHSDLPTTGFMHGDSAYCFAGTDKGKLYMFNAEEETAANRWVLQ